MAYSYDMFAMVRSFNYYLWLYESLQMRLTKTNYKIPFNEILLLSPDCFMQAITTAFYSRVVVLVWFLLCPTYEVITSNVCAGPEAYSFEGT